MASAAFPLEVLSTVSLQVTNITPSYKVDPGSSIVITGSGFDTTAANNVVTFRGSAGPLTSVVSSATVNSLTVIVPFGAQCGNVRVSVGSQTSNARALVVSGSACLLALADVVGGGGPGDLILIEGTGFDSVVPGNNVVTFDASSGTVAGPVIAAGLTQLQVRVPDGVVQGNITVTAGGQTSSAMTFRPVSPTSPSSVSVIVTSPAAVGAYQATLIGSVQLHPVV